MQKSNKKKNIYLSKCSQNIINAALSKCLFVLLNSITVTAQRATFASSLISSYFK